MTTVSDPSANAYEKIERAAQVLRSSKQNKEVFEIIYSGGKFKSMEDLKSKVTKFNTNTYKAVMRLYGEDIIDKKIIKKTIHYGKKAFYVTNRDKILKLSSNAKRLKNYPTKRKLIGSRVEKTYVFSSKPDIEQIYIEDVDSFKRVRDIKSGDGKYLKTMPERVINTGICKIINQSEKKDWGGEKNDIYTNNITLKGSRKSAAFALKGKAVKNKLVPAKMGKNGDQISRLFESTADIYFVVHNNDIAESVVDLMQTHAIERSISKNKKIYFCVIDGKDLARLIKAYPKEFSY